MSNGDTGDDGQSQSQSKMYVQYLAKNRVKAIYEYTESCQNNIWTLDVSCRPSYAVNGGNAKA